MPCSSASGATELYVADLDADPGAPPAARGGSGRWPTRGCRVLVDSGIRTAADANARLRRPGRRAVVAGTETLRGSAISKALAAAFGADQVVLSLDLRNGRLIGDERGLGRTTPSPVGVVGRGRGSRGAAGDRAGPRPGRDRDRDRDGSALRANPVRVPDVELIAGGGVRTWDDVDRLGASRASNARAGRVRPTRRHAHVPAARLVTARAAGFIPAVPTTPASASPHP